MSGDLAIGLIGGLLLGATVMGVFMGTVAHQNYERYKAQVTINFDLQQTIIDLESKAYPEHWMMVAEGAEDPVVVRGRPDSDRHPQNGTSSLSEDVETDIHGQQRIVKIDVDGDIPEAVSFRDE